MKKQSAQAKPVSFSAQDFINKANLAYREGIKDILYEENGQLKLIFFHTNIIRAFMEIKHAQPENMENIKRAIAKGFGKAVLAVFEEYITRKYNARMENISEQIYFGQFTEKKGKIFFWVEVSAFGSINDKELAWSYKLNMDNQSIAEEKTIITILTQIQKAINKEVILL